MSGFPSRLRAGVPLRLGFHPPTGSGRAGRRVTAAIASATLLVGVMAVPIVHPATAFASDIAGFTTVYGTDVVQAGFGGMRYNGTGTLTVSGVSGTVTNAYLYWQGPTNSLDPSANAAATFTGVPVAGTNIGFSGPSCWYYTNSQAYRADVTSLVTGNGSYALAGLLKDGWNISANGASLIVFYDDGNPGNDRDVVLLDGNDSNFVSDYDPEGWAFSLPGIQYTSGAAAITLHVSDGQASYDDDALVLNGSTLVATGPIFGGDSVPGGPFNADGNMWDVKSFDVTSFLDPGQNTLTLTTGIGRDCHALVVAAIDLPAGSAPGPDPIVSISAPLSGALYPIGTTVDLTAPFSDAGTADTHTCTVNWDDGSGAVGATVSEAAGSGTCSSSKTYTTPGIYDLTVAVTDDDGGFGTADVMIVVYDPSGGFVTGGGWINSPAGAYVASPDLTGKATFGFVSKYKKGASVPDGNTEFQFKAGGLNFSSTSYQWLVVNQNYTNAQFKGTGTINGAGTYGFMLWATDGSPDTFRIQITDAGGATVYDNGVQQAIDGGSIVVHK